MSLARLKRLGDLSGQTSWLQWQTVGTAAYDGFSDLTDT